MTNTDSDVNDDLKEAIISCAREEMRKFIGAMLMPGITIQANGISPLHCSRPPTNNEGRQTPLVAECSSARSRRPKTAGSPLFSTEKAYQPRPSKSCRKINTSNSTLRGVTLSSHVEEKCDSTSSLSFASTKWIEKSAKLIKKSSKQICNIEPTRTGSCSQIHLNESPGTSLEQKSGSNPVLGIDYPSAKDAKRPLTAGSIKNIRSRIRQRPLSRPSTALERRAPTRPTTAYLVRAKAEALSETLLRPISMNPTSEVPEPLPFTMGENEWENELARHIVSVYNNKVVSDVKDSQVNALEENSSSISPKAEFVGETTLAFFLDSSTESSMVNSGRKKGSLDVDTIKKDKLLRQTKQLLMSSTPQMIWLAGTGGINHEWQELQGLDYFSSASLYKLYQQEKYLSYILMLKSAICSNIAMNNDMDKDRVEVLWRRIVIATNTLSTQLITDKKFPQAIEMLETMATLLDTDFIQSQDCKQELYGILKDSNAHYYSKRGKPSAALQYIISATNTEKTRKVKTSISGKAFNIQLARCYLHRACILKQLNRFNESMKAMKRVLMMVDSHLIDDMLQKSSNSEISDASSKYDSIDPQVIALLSVTYHNIAVIQIILGHIGDACISSQNCRRLCRLCISITSRYVPQFEETHMKAIYEMSNMLRSKQTEEQAIVFQKLVTELFD